MGAIAVQSSINEMGKKAVTELPEYDFNSIAIIQGKPFAANKQGLYQLNSGTTDSGTNFVSSVIFATTDFNIKNPKRLRYLYIGFDAENSFTVSVMVDNQIWRNYSVIPSKTGLQQKRIPIGKDGQGRYWTIKISSNSPFRIDQLDALIVIKSAGNTDY